MLESLQCAQRTYEFLTFARKQGTIGAIPSGAELVTHGRPFHIKTLTDRFPFGYSDVGTPNSKGEQIVTYPVDVTRLLQLPLDKNTKTSKQEKRERTATKKRMSAQLNLF